MPARKKPTGARQGHRRTDGVTVLPRRDDQRVPPVPTVQGGLLKSFQDACAAFWRSVSAQAADDVDSVVAERWIVARDEWQRCMNAMRRSRVVEGSTGQPALNPLATWIATREGEMTRCERQLGIGSKFRVDLGISYGQARLNAGELNRMTAESADPAADDPAEAELLEDFDRE